MHHNKPSPSRSVTPTNQMYTLLVFLLWSVSFSTLSATQIKVGASTFAHELPHLPVSLGTLKMSCTTLVGQAAPNPKYLPGYRLWKEAHDAGHAGVYTISVAEIEIVAVTERTLQTPEVHN